VPEEIPREIALPRLSPTGRLVGLAPVHLLDARDGARPDLSTALRLAWRDDRLLVRFDCRHRGIAATLSKDNAGLWTEDVVEAFLCWADPPVRYIELEVNPLGAKFSAVVDSPNLSREGMSVHTFPFPGFKAEVSIRDHRWSARLSIPFEGVADSLAPLANPPRPSAAVRFPSGSRRPAREARRPPTTFLANFFRIDRTSGEFSALFPTFADPPDFHVPKRFGRFRLAP
jgi:hypothetical protein